MRSHRCDKCKKVQGIDFVDHFWLCAACRREYFMRLEMERYSPEEEKESHGPSQAW